jgi:hypothetical protein
MRFFLLSSAVAAAALLVLLPATPGESRGARAAGTRVSYEKDIEPILVRRCHLCHDAVARRGNLDMSSYETLMKGGQGGKALVPGRSSESLIVKMILRQQKPFMPPATEEPVAMEELLLMKQWIDEGARGPGGSKTQP